MLSVLELEELRSRRAVVPGYVLAHLSKFGRKWSEVEMLVCFNYIFYVNLLWSCTDS